MNKITLLTGGGRSGKSRYALELASMYRQKAFIATAEAFDDEMRTRIANHRKERSPDFFVVEEPINLAKAIHGLPESTEIVIIDCLTIWLCNLMCRDGFDCKIYEPIQMFLKILRCPPFDLVIVTNELGMGIIPMDKTVRRYRDFAGSLNQEMALLADRVILMVSGIPLVLKDNINEQS